MVLPVSKRLRLAPWLVLFSGGGSAATVDRAVVSCCSGSWLSHLEFSTRQDLHGRCRKWVSRNYIGCAVNACCVGFDGFLLVLVNPVGVFVTDATVTLIRRLMRGEKVYEAHRSHAYQFAARRFGQHLPVTLFVGAINIVWLAPIAWSVARGLLPGELGVVIAYLPLVFLRSGIVRARWNIS